MTASDFPRTLLQLFEANVHAISLSWFAQDTEPQVGWTALVPRDEQGWITLTGNGIREHVRSLAAGLVDAGLKAGDRVALMMSNRPEHWLSDIAVLYAGGVPSTFYPTLSADQLRAQALHLGVTTAILDGSGNTASLLSSFASAGVRSIIALGCYPPFDSREDGLTFYDDLLRRGRALLASDSDFLDRRVQPLVGDDLATVIFTSGTTAEPKAVPLTHSNVIAAASDLLDEGILPTPYRSVSYLPTAHILDRLCNIYVTVMHGGDISFSPTQDALHRVVGRARPTSFVGVPRIWEKFLGAMNSMGEGQEILSAVGLQDVLLATTAGAPMSATVAEGLRSRGLPLVDIWGLTEVSGAITATSISDSRPRSVGRAMSHVEIDIAEDGEVLVRGPQIAPGYLKADGTLDSLVDADGWFPTGDLGSVDDDGYLYLTDRKKEIIVTSGGKNVSPVAVESLILRSPLISQAAVFGNNRPYVVALLVIDPDYVQARAETQIPAPALDEEIADVMRSVNRQVSRSEGIKRWHVVSDQWTTDDGTLTPTQKMRRGVIEARYRDILDGLYTDARATEKGGA